MADNGKFEQGYDPGREHLGEVYAKALLGATEKAGTSDAVLVEFESFVVDVLNKMPRFAETLFSLRVKHEDKVHLLDKAFAGKMSATLLNFLKVLSKHGRLDCVRQILDQSQRQLSLLRGRVEVLVTSAAVLSSQSIEQLTAKLTAKLGKQVTLKLKVDPALLGGLTVRVGDTVYDSSIATQLQKMKDVALERTEQKIRQTFDRFMTPSAT